MIKNNKLSIESIVSQTSGNIVSDMDEEKVMLSIKNGKYYNLGEIGGEIWDMIESPISVKELVTILLSQYEVSEQDCEAQVIALLEQLLEEGLINVEVAA
ncbi:lasso peptide biosynthesis PqqD family chaperone [Fredinandcohnia quinoae]|uniref:Lasso peptide biosynthesis PqqD family chaperone n=1 Tax=Fredinandcohnia quinoae TaxID=2918902 RepID=A0AAW5E4Q8_9BACI|nr:lasso peptide biosynthesis PqqD family chaperone [Fredinandcohnia sp. SECRCQ15]MCH1624877.1 lasso peptide biosynthesis PqqD family chaperone [Fredinandcohnia sp. SECRCQ15]